MFQLIDESGCRIFVALDAAEFVLPQSGEFCAFEEFLVDCGDEFDSGRSCDEVFALLADVTALEKGFDDGGAR